MVYRSYHRYDPYKPYYTPEGEIEWYWRLLIFLGILLTIGLVILVCILSCSSDSKRTETRKNPTLENKEIPPVVPETHNVQKADDEAFFDDFNKMSDPV